MIMTVWAQDYECMTMTVMTENKLETNQQEQQEVEKWYLEPLLAVKKWPGHLLYCKRMHSQNSMAN